METANRPRIAILNTSPDLINPLTEILDLEGFDCVPGYIVDLRTGKHDLGAFLAEHHPDVVIYDVAIPYVENWHFFQQLRATSGLNPCQFVVVTTNKQALDHLVGETDCLEIVGKPIDLSHLVAAIRAALEHDPHQAL